MRTRSPSHFIRSLRSISVSPIRKIAEFLNSSAIARRRRDACPGPEANVNGPTILIIWRKLHVTRNKGDYTGARDVPLAQF